MSINKHLISCEIEEICHPKTINFLCEAHGEDTVRTAHVGEWHKKFLPERRQNVKDDERPGGPDWQKCGKGEDFSRNRTLFVHSSDSNGFENGSRV